MHVYACIILFMQNTTSRTAWQSLLAIFPHRLSCNPRADFVRGWGLHGGDSSLSPSPKNPFAYDDEPVENFTGSASKLPAGRGDPSFGLEDRGRLRRARLSTGLIFVVNGLVVAVWASRVPDFQERLHLAPAILGLELMMAALGSVVAMPMVGWLIHRFRSRRLVVATSLGACVSLPLIGLCSSVGELSLALLFYGAMCASMDVAMNTHGVLLEKRHQRHIMSSFHALFSVGGLAGSTLSGLLVSRGIAATTQLWASGAALSALCVVSFSWLALPPQTQDEASGETRGSLQFSVTLCALALLGFCIMLVEGAMTDWSTVFLRTGVAASPGLAPIGFAAFSGAMALGRATGDYLTTKLGPAVMGRYGTLMAFFGFSLALVSGSFDGAVLGFTCVGAGLATIIPNTLAASGNIAGSSPGPSIAAVTTAGYLGFLAGPPLIGFGAQISTLRNALWILVVLSGFSTFVTGFLKRTLPLQANHDCGRCARNV